MLTILLINLGITLSRWSGVELADYPTLKAWEERVLARPAVEKGRHVPDKHHREILQDTKLMAAFEKRGKDFYRQQEAKAAQQTTSSDDSKSEDD